MIHDRLTQKIIQSVINTYVFPNVSTTK